MFYYVLHKCLRRYNFSTEKLTVVSINPLLLGLWKNITVRDLPVDPQVALAPTILLVLISQKIVQDRRWDGGGWSI